MQSSVTELGIGPPCGRPGEQHEQASASAVQLGALPTAMICSLALAGLGLGTIGCVKMGAVLRIPMLDVERAASRPGAVRRRGRPRRGGKAKAQSGRPPRLVRPGTLPLCCVVCPCIVTFLPACRPLFICLRRLSRGS